MVSCPSCGQPVSGRARRCGYCGQSLVEDYFSGGIKEAGIPLESPAGGAVVAATVLGAFASAALAGAVVFQMLALFGYGAQAQIPALTGAWWLRTGAMTLLPVIFFVHQVAMQGLRRSMWLSGVWLFLAGCGLTVTLQGYLSFGSAAFYGMTMIPYLLVAGCSLAIVAMITAILAFRGREDAL